MVILFYDNKIIDIIENILLFPDNYLTNFDKNHYTMKGGSFATDNLLFTRSFFQNDNKTI